MSFISKDRVNMANTRVLLFIPYLIFIPRILAKTNDMVPILNNCEKINSCSCHNTTHVFDLSPLAFNNGSARFIIKIPHQNFTYYWNPCYGFSYPSQAPKGKCSDVAICVTNNSYYDNIGTQDSTRFTFNYPFSQLLILYTHRSSNNEALTAVPRLATALILCSDEDPGIALSAGEILPGKYEFAYRGIYGCGRVVPIVKPYTMSSGSVLIIGFFIVLFIYLVLGATYQKLIAHEEGWRLIPQYDAWISILNDIKIGALFVITCGQHTPPQCHPDQPQYNPLYQE